jgi:hypothetical protein
LAAIDSLIDCESIVRGTTIVAIATALITYSWLALDAGYLDHEAFRWHDAIDGSEVRETEDGWQYAHGACFNPNFAGRGSTSAPEIERLFSSQTSFDLSAFGEKDFERIALIVSGPKHPRDAFGRGGVACIKKNDALLLVAFVLREGGPHLMLMESVVGEEQVTSVGFQTYLKRQKKYRPLSMLSSDGDLLVAEFTEQEREQQARRQEPSSCWSYWPFALVGLAAAGCAGCLVSVEYGPIRLPSPTDGTPRRGLEPVAF